MLSKHLAAIDTVGEGAIHLLRLLTTAEIELIAKSVSGLLRFQGEERLFSVAEMNVAAFDAFVDESFDTFVRKTRTSILGSMPGSEAESLSIEMNRHFLNALTSMRMYLDHAETALKRTFGGASAEFKAFRANCSQQFDSNPSYGFIYKLRNYTQHCGMPIAQTVLSVSIKSTPTELTAARTSILAGDDGYRSLSVYCNRNELLRDFDWSKKVREFIESLDEDIEATSHLRKSHASLRVIHERLLSTILPNAKVHAAALNGFLVEVQQQFPTYTPIVALLQSGDRTRLRMEGFPIHEVHRLLEDGEK